MNTTDKIRKVLQLLREVPTPAATYQTKDQRLPYETKDFGLAGTMWLGVGIPMRGQKAAVQSEVDPWEMTPERWERIMRTALIAGVGKLYTT